MSSVYNFLKLPSTFFTIASHGATSPFIAT